MQTDRNSGRKTDRENDVITAQVDYALQFSSFVFPLWWKKGRAEMMESMEKMK